MVLCGTYEVEDGVTGIGMSHCCSFSAESSPYTSSAVSQTFQLHDMRHSKLLVHMDDKMAIGPTTTVVKICLIKDFIQSYTLVLNFLNTRFLNIFWR